MNKLYDTSFEHDACGIGAVVSIDGVKSHKIVSDALLIVEKLEHRAGKDALGEIGDGVGIFLQISHDFFSSLDLDLNDEGDYGVGMFFMPQDKLKQYQVKKLFEVLVKKNDLDFIAWRKVPIDEKLLSVKAEIPTIMQCFIKRPLNLEKGLDFDRKLYVLRREAEQSFKDTYIVSLSSRTIVYKGMFLVDQLRKFYLDLQSPLYKSAIAMVHSRFSTNTKPSWKRAHPNRFSLHNGEINTIRGNVDRMHSRQETMESSYFKSDIDKVYPVVCEDGSDSAMFDNTLEFLYMNGVPLPLALMMMIPEPWRNDKNMSQKKKDLYHYYATMMEAWDGPAAILFSDGDLMGAVLDRNGLRPARYYILKDNILILSSEVGVLDIKDEDIVQKSRLEPGKMLLVDTKEKKLIFDKECKEYYSSLNPYGEWLDLNMLKLKNLNIPNKEVIVHSQDVRDKLYKVFGYSYECVKNVILPMAKNGLEPTNSMGTDIPLAIFSSQHQSLFKYFKQRFAQITNPPFDSLREKTVVDTSVYVGSDGNILEAKGENCRVLEINNPILTGTDLLKIKALDVKGLKTETLSLLYYKNTSLEYALEQLFVKCDKLYNKGYNIIVLSDRGLDENRSAIPSLLAVSAVEQYLVRTKKRTAVSIILESGEIYDPHQAAAVLAYGARCIHPYLAHECIKELIDLKLLDKDLYVAVNDYNHALLHGIVKISAKMGISTIQSYQSAQIFEAVGLDKTLVDKYFTNTISRIGGITLEHIEKDIEYRHSLAFDTLGLNIDTSLDSLGLSKLRSGDEAEKHLYNPLTITKLQMATRENNYAMFKEFSSLINDKHKSSTLRGQLEFDFTNIVPIDIDEVEPASSIVKRFKTGAMSYGSISKEAHECLAVAMNHLGGKSNSGEGGEDSSRFNTDKNSAIKQVASGRFGVTSEYLLSAKEIQIKLAQGAKPGEGGHLPSSKVYPWIAKTRASSPGVTLISPPPHHDIYSIEDINQLIYDLKNVNQDARVSVKLVSEAGVGTIAVGATKAGASVVLISGYDGGTGAAPFSSILDAGLPWELGLAETHQTLLDNNLRSNVILETDGKLMTGRDVAIAAILGAEEFGFATAPLVSLGCMMMRVCNLDTCPFGIATQNEELRKRFRGKSEYVINFMLFIAEELREILASLGLRSMDELIGRTDLVKQKEGVPVDLCSLIDKKYAKAFSKDKKTFDFKLSSTIDEKILVKKFKNAIKEGKSHKEEITLSSIDRTVGTILGSYILKHGKKCLENDTYRVKCYGGAGQSFGAFIPKGLTLELVGDANDYLAKGLSGGKIVVYPSKESKFKAEENIIIGNVALYGATSGECYINGKAGERFMVRSSGAKVVCEGCGDHALEYMTGGLAVILGETGKNVAAGMSGGTAYIYDKERSLYQKLNKDLVTMCEVKESDDILELKDIISTHYRETSSSIAKKILDDFDNQIKLFKKIEPNDYKRMQRKIKDFVNAGMSEEKAALEAFKASVL